MIKHIDLFSGIGGFALAANRVFGDVEHVFVEIDPFCREVLRKHYPESIIYGDIRTFANTQSQRFGEERVPIERSEKWSARVDLLTGGFPCQPFSQAGKRGGTTDNRYLWPEMFRVIQEFQPTWIIAENVRGLLTWNEGLVFEQVCTDLESENYQIQPFVISACSVNAPHRRERVWFIANKSGQRLERCNRTPIKRYAENDSNVTHCYTERGGASQYEDHREQPASAHQWQDKPQYKPSRYSEGVDWDRDWREVALETCNVRVDDGLPSRMVRLPSGARITYAKWRRESLKAYGNAIVPQVVEQIMLGML